MPRWAWWLGTGGVTAAAGLLFVVAAGFDDAPVSSELEDRPGSATLRIAEGQLLYAEHCASCHGANLEGQPNWQSRLPDGRFPAPPHDETGHTWHHSDAYLFDVTKRGGQATALAGFVSGMPEFGSVLSDEQIRSTLAFIKSRWSTKVRALQPR